MPNLITLHFSPEAVQYIGSLIAERPIKEAGKLAIDLEQQFYAEMERLKQEEIRRHVEAAAKP